MTADVVTVGPGTPLAEAADLMERHRVKRLPVTQNERLVGIIARADLISRVGDGRAATGRRT